MDMQLIKKFGRTISRDQAGELYSRFFDIKTRSVEKIRAALEGDDEAIRYYCGRRGMNPLEEDLLFFFDKDSLTRIVSMINAGDADGMVITHGSRGVEVPEDGIDNGEESGRPTLMLFPFKNEEAADASGEKQSIIRNMLDYGEEHPGTGGKGGKLTRLKPGAAPVIPELIDLIDIHRML